MIEPRELLTSPLRMMGLFLVMTLPGWSGLATAAEPLRWSLGGKGDAAGEVEPGTKVLGGVAFVPQHPTGQGRSAQLDGQGGHLEYAPSTPLDLGTGDFTASLWVQLDESGRDDHGDLLSQFDANSRKGWSLSIRTNGGVTNSQVNSRQLQFGIDAGTDPVLVDVGRPGKSLYGMSIAVHAGRLYVGTCEAGAKERGHVYRYDGPNQWFDCGTPDECNAITSMCVHDGQLYVGSGKYRLKGSSLAESENPAFGGRIYRFSGPGQFELVGQLPEAESVGGMVSYGGKLYATSLYPPAGFFRYEGGSNWTRLDSPNGKRTQALIVHDGWLWATSYDGGQVYRFNGEKWEDLGVLEANTQNYSFAVFGGKLYIGSWPSGKVYRHEGDRSFVDTGRLGEELEVMGMLVHNGGLYAGTLPLAELYRYDGDAMWKKISRLDLTPEVKYRRVWTAATYRGDSYWTTLPTGHIHRLRTGAAVSWDELFPSGWHHVAARKAGGRLSLWVDGKQVAESEAFDAARLPLKTPAPLRIGKGPGSTFRGTLAHVRLDRRALTPEELTSAAQR